MNVTTVVTAPDAYTVMIHDSDRQVSLLTPTRAREYARLLRADGWGDAAAEIEDAAQPPDTCEAGDGNYSEWGSYCGPCAERAEDDAEQDRRTRTAGA